MRAPDAVITHTSFFADSENLAIPDETAASDFKIDLTRAVQGLPEMNRTVVRLRLGLNAEGEVSNKETAMRLGLKESAVSRLLARGLQDLRFAMADYESPVAA
jgi:DNA-directed RNA polymerase specialized sigma subunit